MKTAHGTTVDFLGQAVVAGRYAVAALLPPEPLLCVELGVSRTVVREAVKSLIGKGMLSVGPRVGTRVLASNSWNWFDHDVIAWQSAAGIAPDFIRDLQELRRALEPAAVRLAAQRASAQDIEAIERAYRGMEQAVDEDGDYVSQDLKFHQGLLRASGNRMLMQMSKVLAPLLRIGFELSTRRKDGPRQSLPLHRAVLDAVTAHDADAAERAILELLQGASLDIEMVLGSRRRRPGLDRSAPRKVLA